MLNLKQVTEIVYSNLPNSEIQDIVSYKDLYLVKAFRDDPFEEDMDPFYSVHKETGEFKEFSVLTDGNTSEIISLFSKEVK